MTARDGEMMIKLSARDSVPKWTVPCIFPSFPRRAVGRAVGIFEHEVSRREEKKPVSRPNHQLHRLGGSMHDPKPKQALFFRKYGERESPLEGALEGGFRISA